MRYRKLYRGIGESKRLVEERKRAEELDRIFERLPKENQEKIEERVRESLIESGINPSFILPTLLRIERNNLLEKENSLMKQGN